MKEISTLTIKLLLICAIVAALLAFVNDVTAPIIAENAANNFAEAMSEVLPDGKPFSEVDPDGIKDFASSETGVKIESIHKGDNGGYVVSAICAEGYGGDISIMVGITPDIQINQVKIMSMSETPGLGAKAQDEEFISQYNGMNGDIEVIKSGTNGDNQIQAISGATITSKAVTKAVNASLEIAEFAEGGSSK